MQQDVYGNSIYVWGISFRKRDVASAVPTLLPLLTSASFLRVLRLVSSLEQGRTAAQEGNELLTRRRRPFVLQIVRQETS